MVKDFFVSFKDNIKGKVTNPFFGTLIVVWIIHNYKFVYTVFNFRASTGLDDRLIFIGTYLERGSFLPDLGWCILWALGVLLSTYILLNLSRLIVLWFEKRITPRVYKITDSKSIVTIDVYNNQVTETNKFEKRYKDEQEAKLDLQNKYDELEKKLQYQMKLKEAREDFREPDVEDKKESQVELNKDIETFSNEELLSLLTNSKINDVFDDVTLIVLKNLAVSDDGSYDELILKDLLEKIDEDQYGNPKFAFTVKGKQFRIFRDIYNDNKSVTPKALTREQLLGLDKEKNNNT